MINADAISAKAEATFKSLIHWATIADWPADVKHFASWYPAIWLNGKERIYVMSVYSNGGMYLSYYYKRNGFFGNALLALFKDFSSFRIEHFERYMSDDASNTHIPFWDLALTMALYLRHNESAFHRMCCKNGKPFHVPMWVPEFMVDNLYEEGRKKWHLKSRRLTRNSRSSSRSG